MAYYKAKWDLILDTYLNTIEFFCDFFQKLKMENKMSFTDVILRMTFFIFAVSIIIFFSSCQKALAQRLPESMIGEALVQANLHQNLPKILTQSKKSEQLFIQRDQIIIKDKESGSSTGSLWSDSIHPKALLTEYNPSSTGDILTVNIPDDLQPKQTDSNNTTKMDPLKSVKFEVVALEPGGDAYLRAIKNYKDENGIETNIIVLAKAPRRNIHNSEISANDVTSVSVSVTKNGEMSSYDSLSWDSNVTKKIASYAPDMQLLSKGLEAEKNDLSVRKKAVEDQKKSLDAAADRLKKDRARVDADIAKARALLDSSTVSSGDSKATTANSSTNKNNSTLKSSSNSSASTTSGTKK